MVEIPINLEVIETSQLVKYAEGAVPGVDEPYEVLECSRKLSRDEIQELIHQGRLKITPEGKAEWIPLEK